MLGRATVSYLPGNCASEYHRNLFTRDMTVGLTPPYASLWVPAYLHIFHLSPSPPRPSFQSHSSPRVNHGEHRVPSHSPPSDLSVAEGAQRDHWERQGMISCIVNLFRLLNALGVALPCHPILRAVLRLVAAFARVQSSGCSMGRTQVAARSRPQA